MKKHLFGWTCLLFVILTLLGCVLASFDDSKGLHSLQALSGGVNILSALGQDISVAGQYWFFYTCITLVAMLVLLAVTLSQWSLRLFVGGVILALLAQCILVDRMIWAVLLPADIATIEPRLTVPLGIALYGLAALVLILTMRRFPESTVFDDGREQSGKFGGIEFFVLTVIFVFALVLRMYAINHVVNYFDGELSPYAAGATSLKGMFFANRGFYGPWAPLGLLYYLPIYFTTSLWDVDLTSLRLSSAIVGLFTIPCVYLLGARLAGRSGGLIAAALFSMNVLHIGWSRTDIHPHGVTTWPTVLMCFFLLKAFDTRKIGYAFGVALMMGLSWHQYPSGQSAVSIPLIALGMYFLLNRGKLALGGWQILVVMAGVGLWALGLPLSYYPTNGDFVFANPFNLTGPRASWGGDQSARSSMQVALGVLTTAQTHLWDVIQGLFYKVPYLFHQEWVPYQSGIHHRTVPWIEMSFVVVGLCILFRYRRRFESAVILAWLIAAILPGILSERAYPKRLSTFFPALDILAAVALAATLAVLSPHLSRWRRHVGNVAIALVMGGYLCFLHHVWFSGRFFRYGEPPEVQVARDIAARIGPKTLVYSFFGGGFEQGKYSYLLLDHFSDPRNRPNLFLLIHQNELPALISNPTDYQQRMLLIWPYVWTKLRDQVDETRNFTEWERVMFLFLHVDSYGQMVSELEAQAKAGCLNPIVHRFEPPQRGDAGNPILMVGIECKLTDFVSRQPVAQSTSSDSEPHA